MDALVITLREGLEAALVVAVMFAYLAATGRDELRRWVWAGLGTAVGISFLAAAALPALGIEPESATFEGVMYLLAAALVATMVVWMWRTGRGAAANVRERMAGATAQHRSSTSAAIAVFTVAFLMVLREGVETVLLLATTALGESSLLATLLGAAAGLAIAVGLGVLIVRGSLRLDTKLFFSVTSIVLLLLAVKLALTGVAELGEAGVITLAEPIEEFAELAESDVLGGIIVAGLLAAPVLALFRHRPREAHPAA